MSKAGTGPTRTRKCAAYADFGQSFGQIGCERDEHGPAGHVGAAAVARTKRADGTTHSAGPMGSGTWVTVRWDDHEPDRWRELGRATVTG